MLGQVSYVRLVRLGKVSLGQVSQVKLGQVRLFAGLEDVRSSPLSLRSSSKSALQFAIPTASQFRLALKDPEPPTPTPHGGYSKSTDVYYWHKLCKTSASRLFRTFLNTLHECGIVFFCKKYVPLDCHMTVPDTTDVLSVQKVTKPFMSWKAGKFKLDCHFDYPKIANHHDFE